LQYQIINMENVRSDRLPVLAIEIKTALPMCGTTTRPRSPAL
jgi:hypothetical protein